MDDGNDNRVQAVESVILEGFTYCQASLTGKVLSLMIRGFNSSLEIDRQAGFTFSGKYPSIIPFRGVYVDGVEVSDDMNLNLSNEVDGIPKKIFYYLCSVLSFIDPL